MPLLTSALLCLNPEIEKYDYLSISNSNDIEEVSYIELTQDLKSLYYFLDKEYYSKKDFFNDQLVNFYNNIDDDLKIGYEVYNNSYEILDVLYPSIYEHIGIEDVYPTNYGTVIMDWEKENGDIFSLEIGASSLGYFIEVNGRDEKQLDGALIDGAIRPLLEDLSNFLS